MSTPFTDSLDKPSLGGTEEAIEGLRRACHRYSDTHNAKGVWSSALALPSRLDDLKTYAHVQVARELIFKLMALQKSSPRAKALQKEIKEILIPGLDPGDTGLMMAVQGYLNKFDRRGKEVNNTSLD